jgi:hypothetical protein
VLGGCRPNGLCSELEWMGRTCLYLDPLAEQAYVLALRCPRNRVNSTAAAKWFDLVANLRGLTISELWRRSPRASSAGSLRERGTLDTPFRYQSWEHPPGALASGTVVLRCRGYRATPRGRSQALLEGEAASRVPRVRKEHGPGASENRLDPQRVGGGVPASH